MSLEDLIKEKTGNSFKEKLSHYSKFTATSIYRGAIDIFRLPTANRLKKVAESQRTPEFLEEVIGDSVKGSLQLFMLGTFLLSPPLGLTALATNACSYIYEKDLERSTKKRQSEKWSPLKKAYSSLEKIANDVKQFSVKKSLESSSRSFVKFAGTYALVGTMALGHLFAGNALRTTPKYDSSLLNVEVQKISLNKEGKKYEFYLLGEAHLYNYSSSVYVKELIKQKNISLLLSEGVDLSQYSYGEAEQFRQNSPGQNLKEEQKGRITLKDLVSGQDFSEISWRNVCEKLIGTTFAITLLGSDYIYQEPSEICYNKGIPVIFLEKPVFREYERTDKNEERKSSSSHSENHNTFIDGREGVSDASYAILGISGGVALLCAPQIYFFTNSARYFPIKDAYKIIPADMIFGGIIYKRNELMTKEAFKQIIENPKDNCLIRVGIAHSKGIIEEFKKHGEVRVEEVNISVK